MDSPPLIPSVKSASFAALFVRFLLGLLLQLTAVRANDCPSGCVCFISDQVMCRQAQYTSLPSGLSPQLEHLNMNDNQLRRLAADSFVGLARLRTLHLDNNNITEVAAHALRGLSDMEEISLQHNPLDRLAPFSFAGLSNVHRLYLSYNKIRSVEGDAFSNSDNLREVSLTGNPLVTLRTHAFRGFSRVQFFYLPKGIHRVEPDAFSGMRDVGMLRLDGLETPRLERHAFRGLHRVTTFELRGSYVSRLETGAFDGLNDVDYFGLEFNTFGHLESGACDGVGRLRHVVVAGNTIQGVEAGALAGLSRDGRPKRFNFTANRLPCDCRLRYFMDDLASAAGTELAVLEGNVCATPDEAVGEDAAAVDLDAVEPCPTEEAPLAAAEGGERLSQTPPAPSDDELENHVGGISLGVKSAAGSAGAPLCTAIAAAVLLAIIAPRTLSSDGH